MFEGPADPAPGVRPRGALTANVEGTAPGAPWTEGRYRGRRPLYLVSDDNDSPDQITRLYALAVRLTL
ncbi:hypothetical protein [Streptomyces phaeofaciens]|uniref:hypothetical protein n=1 Tax=Streptomyces phaeofaciens TaxID=68254 RepID=UPI00367DACA6